MPSDEKTSCERVKGKWAQVTGGEQREGALEVPPPVPWTRKW